MKSVLKATVRNGRLVLDEPTDLPEGEVVVLRRIEAIGAVGPDGMDDEQRAAVDEELDLALAEADRGETDDFAETLSSLRHRP